MSTIEKLFTIVNNLKVGRGKLSITKKKKTIKNLKSIKNRIIIIIIIIINSLLITIAVKNTELQG